MNENQERAAFEAWAREYSTYPLERDDEPAFGTTGYTSMEQTMLWDAWQARAGKAKAPEGASGGDLDANARPGLAGEKSTCAHEFSLDHASSIPLCVKCGIGEVAANKQARAALAATPAPAPEMAPAFRTSLAYDVGFKDGQKAATPAPAPQWTPEAAARTLALAEELRNKIKTKPEDEAGQGNEAT